MILKMQANNLINSFVRRKLKLTFLVNFGFYLFKRYQYIHIVEMLAICVFGKATFFSSAYLPDPPILDITSIQLTDQTQYIDILAIQIGRSKSE